MAKLSFNNDVDVEKILKLSATIAAAFVRITGRRDLKDDATNDAALALISIEFDETNAGARSYLKKRALGQLIRDYQNKTGQRLKNKPHFVEYTETATRAPETSDDDGDADDDKIAIENALRQFPQRDRAFLAAWVAGKKQIKIAADLGLTRGRISQIITRFKHKARFFKEYGGGVVDVDPYKEPMTEKEKSKYPLFVKPCN